MPSKDYCKRSFKDVNCIYISEASEDIAHHKKVVLISSHAAQFVNDCIYLSLFSYSGTSIRFLVKFANEDGCFAPRIKEKKLEDLTRAKKVLEEMMKGMKTEKRKSNIIKSNIKRVSFWKDIIQDQRNQQSVRRSARCEQSFDFENYNNQSRNTYEKRLKSVLTRRNNLFMEKLARLEWNQTRRSTLK